MWILSCQIGQERQEGQKFKARNSHNLKTISGDDHMKLSSKGGYFEESKILNIKLFHSVVFTTSSFVVLLCSVHEK